MTPRSKDIDKKIQRGYGKEAKKLGLLFDVYRNGTLIASNVYLRPERNTSRNQIEAAVSLRDIVFVTMICDASEFKPGDVFIGQDTSDRYVLSFKWPAKNNIGFRCCNQAFIYRPTQIDTLNPDIAGYGGQLEITNLNLNYNETTHQYSFGSGEPASIYVSKSRTGYGGQMPPSKLPLDVRESQWIFVTEILPGVTFKINDIIEFEEETFQIQAVDKQIPGFYGQIIYCSLKRP